MNKKLLLTVFAFVLLSAVVAQAAATDYVIASYDISNLSVKIFISEVHPAVTDQSAQVQSFTGDGRYILEFSLYLNKSGAPTGYLQGALWNASGSEPDEIVASTVEAVSMATLSTGAASEYTFTFGTNYNVTFGQTYFIGVYCANGTINGSNYAMVMGDDSSPTGAGINYHYEAGGWDQDSLDCIYSITTTDMSGGGTAPFTDETWNLNIDRFTAFIVPLVVILLPALLLIVITRRTDKWVLLIGITIGVGLGYYFAMVPLWLVFLVVIGLIGMAYQSVRGGG